jgi:peptidoglycan/xylan/chitin deacetylase (PgdA/CDA1 family)
MSSVAASVSLALRRALKVVSAVTDRPLRGPRMLIYHQVGAGNGLEMEVTEEDFRRQGDWLASTGAVVSLEEALSRSEDPTPTFVLTFDDGYRDMFQNGFPVLRYHGMPFTLYLTTNPIESGTPLRDDGRSTPVNWDEVGEMIASGLATIGAHTHTHPDFRRISLAEAEDEMGVSNDLIERRTGIRPRHFAYPWGYWAPATAAAVAAAYETATVGGYQSVAGRPLLALPRVPVQRSDGWAHFPARVRGGFRLEDAIRRRTTGYEGP